MLVVLCVACCRMTRDRPRSASFATAPYGAALLLLTSTLRAFTADRRERSRRQQPRAWVVLAAWLGKSTLRQATSGWLAGTAQCVAV